MEWDQALRGSGACSLFLSHSWISHWIDAFAARQQLCILLVRDEQGITGFLPMMRTRYKLGPLGFQALRLLGNDYSQRSGLVILRHTAETLEALFHTLSDFEWQLFHLARIDSADPNIQTIIDNPIFSRTFKRRDYQLPIIDSSGNWNNYLQGQSAHFRRTLRRDRSS